MITAALHVIAVVLFFTVAWQAPWRKSNRATQQPVEVGDTLMFVLGTRDLRAKGPTVQSSRRAPVTPPELPPPPPPPPPPPIAAAPTPADTGTTLPAYDPNASRMAPPPQVGDGRLWVSPRPGLPAPVADALYGDTTGRNTAAIARLKAMVDTLNQVIDQIQRERQRPSWTVGGTPDKPTWGLDSANIHIAGIKIPTPVLAALGYFLHGKAAEAFYSGGNFDEALRQRQLDYMRQDLMQAAARAQTLQQFRRYVRELRDRKQAERDAEERRRAQDTVTTVP